MPKKRFPRMLVEGCVLAGGRSERMGRDKARVRLGGRTLLGHVRAAALAAGLPVRVIRKDAVPRCGPLGGVITALRSTRAEAVLFLSCDMPLISVTAIERLLRTFGCGTRAAFYADAGEGVGFPFAIPVAQLPLVETQLQREQFSLQRLAVALNARRLVIPAREHWRWLNVNTPADLAAAQTLCSRRNRVLGKPPLVPAAKPARLRP